MVKHDKLLRKWNTNKIWKCNIFILHFNINLCQFYGNYFQNLIRFHKWKHWLSAQRTIFSRQTGNVTFFNLPRESRGPKQPPIIYLLVINLQSWSIIGIGREMANIQQLYLTIPLLLLGIISTFIAQVLALDAPPFPWFCVRTFCFYFSSYFFSWSFYYFLT